MNWGLLIISIVSFYGILIVVNIPAPWLGLEFGADSKDRLWYAPPGFVIPLAWFVLFTLLGIGRYILIVHELNDKQYWLYALGFLCAAYAYYTIGLAKITGISALWFGLAGNIAVILFALLVMIKLFKESVTVAWLVFPVILWTLYATLIVTGEMKQQRLI